MILNESSGNRESLPFDLRQKAGPIMFNLAADMASNERERVRRELTHTLKAAIKECLQSRRPPRAITKELLAQPIATLGLPNRVRNALDDVDLKTVGDLMYKGRLNMIRNLGQNGIEQITAALEGLDLYMKKK